MTKPKLKTFEELRKKYTHPTSGALIVEILDSHHAYLLHLEERIKELEKEHM